MSKTNLIVIIAIVALILLGLGFWYWQKTSTSTSGLGGQIFDQTQNPIKNVLPANPFSNYKNPFAQ